MYTHWNGVDVSVRARMARLTVSGGLSTGRTSLDNCDVVESVIVANASDRHTDQRRPCAVRHEPPVLPPGHQLPDAGERIRRVYVARGRAARWDVPEHPRPSARGERDLHVGAGGPVARPAAVRTAPTVTVNVIPPGTMYGDRLNQLDLRLGKDFRVRAVPGSTPLSTCTTCSTAMRC